LVGDDLSDVGFRGHLGRLDHTYAEQSLGSPPSWPIEPSALPKLPGGYDWIDAVALPPCGLVTTTVESSVMASTQRHNVFVADPAPEGARLDEAQVVRIRRPPPAHQARLRRYEPDVAAVAVSARFAEGQGSLIDVPGDCIVDLRRRPELRAEIF
jgi:hypothetical protein